MSHPDCPRQVTFTLPGLPSVKIIATEVAGRIEFVVDVQDSNLSDGDLRALFFHINEAELAGLTVTSSDPLLTEARVGRNNILDLGDGATLAGAVKSGFDVGTEWGTPGGKYDDIDFPVRFAIANGTGDLTLDDIGGMLFGAKLDSVGGKGSVSGSASKLTGFAPWAPDAVDDSYDIYEDGAAGLNSPSKTPTAVVMDVLFNDTDHDTAHNLLTIDHIVDGAGPVHGTVQIVDNKIYYTPDLDFSGTDTFWYCMSDGNGGQDSAQVTVHIAAVADDPIISLAVAQGATINDTLVTVTATQNDADGSEDISSLSWAIPGGTPAGVTITPVGPVSGSGDQLVQQFTVSTAPGMDWNFDVNFTAESREASNGDTETQTQAQHIEIDNTHNASDFTFSTVNQSIWGSGSGEPFDANPFLGLQNQSLDFDPPPIPVSILPPAAVDIDVSGHLTFGFDTVIHLDAGHISADLLVNTVVDSTYNKTTDTIQFSTSQMLKGGSFIATGPNGFVNIDFVMDVDGHASISLEPLDFLTGWANVSGDFSASPPPLNILHIDTNGFEQTWPLLPGIVDLTLSWPETGMTSSTLNDSASDHFLALNVDVDAAAITLFPLLAPIDPDIYSDDNLELLDIDVTGFLSMIQSLAVNLNSLGGSLTLEDGSGPPNFTFGDTLAMMSNFSSHDTNHDGTVDLNVSMTPNVSLTSDASVGVSVGAKVELLRNLPFDLDSVMLFNGELPIADFSVFNDTFPLLGFANQDWALVA